MEGDQSPANPKPATAIPRERCHTRCCQQRGQWIQEQNMTSADVHTAQDRYTQIDSARLNQVRQFSTLPEPPANQRNTCQHYQTDQAQSGFDRQRYWEIPPNTVSIVVPEQKDGILLCCVVDVGHPHQVGL